MMFCYTLRYVQEFQEFVEATIRQKITEVGSLFPVEFTAYTIKLNLPDSPTGWNLTCPSYPAVSAL